MTDKIERLYTIPLQKVYYTGKRNRRATNAVDLIREFLTRHMKSPVIKVSNALNSHIWGRSISKPPRKVKVRAVKDGDSINVYMVDEKLEEPKKEAAKKAPKEEPKPVKEEKVEEKTPVKKESKPVKKADK